jgi:phytoene dehydrogenase-like protein
MMHAGILSDLNLQDFSARQTPADPQLVVTDPVGNAVSLHLDDQSTRAEIRAEYGAGAWQALEQFQRAVRQAADAIALLYECTSSADRRQLYASFSPPVKWLFESSLGEVFASFELPSLVASGLAATAVSITNSSPWKPRTGFALAFMATASVGGHVGAWGLADPPLGDLMAELEATFSRLGGTLVVNDPVQQIAVERNFATTAVTESSLYHADYFVTCVHPLHLSQICPAAVEGEGTVLSKGHDRYRGISASVRLLLDGPKFMDSLLWPQRRLLERSFHILTGGDLRSLHNAFLDIQAGRQISSEPLVSYSFRVGTDQAHVLVEAYVQFVGRDCSHDALVAATIGAIASHYRRAELAVLEAWVFSPRDLESLLDLPGGHPEHLLMEFPEMLAERPTLALADHRTAVSNLLASGAAWFPGGTVSGIPGRNVARLLLGELARRR